MKKMNIALFTAAAMFATSAAVAVEVDGPDLSGRIQTIYNDAKNADEELSNMGGGSVFLAASGSASGLAGGFSMSYYLRALLEQDSNVQNNFPYSYVNFEHEAFTVNVGTNDDLVYRFVESHNFSNSLRSYDGVEAPEFGSSEQVSFMSDLGGSPVTIGLYANDEGDAGINTTQFGISADLGPATLAAVYSASDDDAASNPAGRRDKSIYVGGTYDFGFGNVAARVADLDSGENPYALSVAVPVTANTTIRGFHGNDDNTGTASDSQSTTGAEVRTALGAGLDVFAGATLGEKGDGTSADNIYVGTRLAF